MHCKKFCDYAPCYRILWVFGQWSLTEAISANDGVTFVRSHIWRQMGALVIFISGYGDLCANTRTKETQALYPARDRWWEFKSRLVSLRASIDGDSSLRRQSLIKARSLNSFSNCWWKLLDYYTNKDLGNIIFKLIICRN